MSYTVDECVMVTAGPHKGKVGFVAKVSESGKILTLHGSPGYKTLDPEELNRAIPLRVRSGNVRGLDVQEEVLAGAILEPLVTAHLLGREVSKVMALTRILSDWGYRVEYDDEVTVTYEHLFRVLVDIKRRLEGTTPINPDLARTNDDPPTPDPT